MEAGGDPYRTVAGAGQATFDIRGSTFIGRVHHVPTVDEAEAFMDAVAAEEPNATHHVPAYRIRDGDLLRAWSTDGGEPSGSAGKPALNVLTRRDLENVVAVVTRHFGGTELGVGGLARAYGRAVSLAVDDAGVVDRRPHRQVVLEVDYDDSGTVRGILDSAGVTFEADYAAAVRFEVTAPVTTSEDVLDRVRSATRGRVEVDPS